MILGLFTLALLAAIGGLIAFGLIATAIAWPLSFLGALVLVCLLWRHFWRQEMKKARATPASHNVASQSHRPNAVLRQAARLHDEETASRPATPSSLADPKWFGNEDDPLT